MGRNLKLALSAGVALLILAASAVWAADTLRSAEGRRDMPGRGKERMAGKDGRPGKHGRFGKPVIGVITAVDGDTITIKPEIPDWLTGKLSEHEVSMRQLPESISFRVDSSTKAWRGSAESSPADFTAGERVSAILDGDPRSGTATARRITNEATARQFIGKLRERGQERRERGRERKARMEREGRPLIGTITAIDGSTVTIRPELPRFMLDRLAEQGRTAPQLPESLSFTVDHAAQIYRDSASADLSDFSVGEQIGALVKGDLRGGTATAMKLADIETARRAMEQKRGETRPRQQRY